MPGHDQVIHVGDLVNKGPDSYGVVRYAIQLRAYGVLGNHDIKLVQIAEKLRQGQKLSAKEWESSLYDLAAECPDDVFEYLRQLPHVLRIPQYDTLVVHAGLDPSIPLHEQDSEVITRMRNLMKRKKYELKRRRHSSEDALSVSRHYAALERNRGGKPWASVYNALQKGWRASGGADPSGTEGPDVVSGDGEVARLHTDYKGLTVLFGHDAKRRLQRYDWAVGLDSGCCYGSELTAWVLPNRTLVSTPGWKASNSASKI